MTKYTIGIDTGGTYTDAILLENNSKKIIHWTKELTTHNDLSLGIGRALTSLFQENIQPEEVARIAVSTTLATNAVVEGHGARVGLFVFGYVKHFKLPIVANVFLQGGHDIMGREEQALDLEGLVDTLEGLKDEVDSYAVCGAMSIQNPTHELVAEEAISLVDPKPVFCSHRVSEHAGIRERSATACLHAKLMPVMVDFLSSVQRSMLQVNLHCPVTIICGNAKRASLDIAIERAALTMASGPAATACFGATVGQKKALVVDVGGTTTDICMIENGSPVINHKGCRIGNWQTHVEAVDMFTAAGGGDSQVICGTDGSLSLASCRVQPLSMTEKLPDPEQWLGCGRRCALVMLVPGLDCAVYENDPVLSFLQNNGPSTPERIGQETDYSGIILEKKMERLLFLQRIAISGFTPTDALHIVRGLSLGDKKRAEAGAFALARLLNCEPDDLCEQVIRLAEDAIEKSILEYISRRIWGEGKASALFGKLHNDLFSTRFSLHVPLIGIGAAAKYFLPAIAERLATTVYFPEQYAVGNAIGAALIDAEVLPGLL